MREAQASAKAEAAAAESSAQTVLSESVYSAAYGAQSGMGKSYYSASATKSAIQSFRERTYVLNGAVLSATGIEDHESFVKAVEVGFSESVVGEAAASASSPFLGGETRVHAPSTGFAHLALAFEGPKSSALANVIKQCISLSSEGVEGFADTGIVGVYGGAAPSDAAATVDALIASITTAPVAELVERAKGLAKAEAIFALDGDSKAVAEAMTSSVMESGAFSSAGVAAAYDAITVADVTAAFQSMAKSNPAMAAVGDLSSTPYQGSISGKFG